MASQENQLQHAKQVVRRLHKELEVRGAESVVDVLSRHVSNDFYWRGLHPFHEQTGPEAVADVFWKPLGESFKSLSRREDVFLAGFNNAGEQDLNADVVDPDDIWVASMGHFFGLFDEPWLDIPATRKLSSLRYAEFYRVVDGVIVEGSMFFDLLALMQQAGCYPLAPETGHTFMYPGPKTHDGILLTPQPAAEGRSTMALINRMVGDLSELNVSGNDRCPPELLARCWSEDMLWYGPAGIGATYTIERYQQQHQYPFRAGLGNKKFNGHVCRIAEGNYGCFFGWPNLSNQSLGGFLGLPAARDSADMRVVDMYRREGDKLVENWVLIDIPHYLAQQGLDVLARMRQLAGLEAV